MIGERVFTIEPCVEPRALLFGEPYREDHPWIAQGGNSPRVHLLTAANDGCLWCRRGIASAQCSSRKPRVTSIPQRTTCRQCLTLWLKANRLLGPHRDDRRIVDAIMWWRIYGARAQRQAQSGNYYDRGRDDPLYWYQGYFRATHVTVFARQPASRRR